jgi:hypothetical protein
MCSLLYILSVADVLVNFVSFAHTVNFFHMLQACFFLARMYRGLDLKKFCENPLVLAKYNSVLDI